MLTSNSSAVACLVLTTSGRILVLWDQDDTLPFQYPQLALLLASLFHFAQSQRFGRLELQKGFTVLISSHVEAQVSVAVICTTPSPSLQDSKAFANNVASLQLGQFKSLIILQEFIRCYESDLQRLVAENLEHVKTQAEEYTLTSALDGFRESCDGTLNEFVAFQTDFVGLVMETSARGIVNSLVSWTDHDTTSMDENLSAIHLIHGFLMNAETGDIVYSTSHGTLVDHEGASRKLAPLFQSTRVQQLIKDVALALLESASVLIEQAHDKSAAVVVRLVHRSKQTLSQLFVALRMVSTGLFATGVVFFGDNPMFPTQENKRRCSQMLQQTLATHPGGKRMLRLLQDPSVDVDLHVGCNSAPEKVWKAMDMLMKPLPLKWSETAVKSDNVNILASERLADGEEQAQ